MAQVFVLAVQIVRCTACSCRSVGHADHAGDCPNPAGARRVVRDVYEVNCR